MSTRRREKGEKTRRPYDGSMAWFLGLGSQTARVLDMKKACTMMGKGGVSNCNKAQLEPIYEKMRRDAQQELVIEVNVKDYY